MDVEEMKPEVKGILRQLQRSIKCVLQESQVWQNSHEESSKLLESILYVAEQLQVTNGNVCNILLSI